MRLQRTTFTWSAAKGARAFTLVEVLAALVFMAILVPVTMHGITIANRAGQVGDRKAAAGRIAERVLNELLVTEGMRQNSSTGQIEERNRLFKWTMRSEPWREDRLNLVSVTVAFEVQGKEYDVTVSTLFDPTLSSVTSSPQMQ